LGQTSKTCKTPFAVSQPDVAPVFFLLGVYFLLQTVFLHYLGRFIVDSGKELMVPWTLLQGKGLYREVFWLYGPWAPYFNFLMYALFGVHSDVLLWTAKFLGAGVVLTVYGCLRSLVSPKTACFGALAVMAFSTTSNYFTWPYSFSNLWATWLALLAVHLIARWRQTGNTRLLVLSAIASAIVANSKFIIALPVLVVLWFTLLLESRQKNTRVTRRDWLGAATYTVAVLFTFFTVLWYFGRGVAPESYRLQIGAVFHARHLVAAGLYDRLRETALLQNGLSPENLAAAFAVWICPLGVLIGMAVWLRLWFKDKDPGLLLPFPYVLFAAGNLLQMNSSVHAPYVFPATSVALFWACEVWGKKSGIKSARLAKGVLWAVISMALLMGGLRLLKISSQRVEVVSAHYRFNWTPGLAARLQSLSAFITANTKPDERIIIFSPHDYLYFICDRPPALGYFYTWYEPFHDAQAANRVIASLKSKDLKLVVSNSEDPFALAFAPEYRSHPIYQTLVAEFEPKVDPDHWAPFIIWVKKTTPTESP